MMKEMKDKKIIAVIGGNQCSAKEARLADEVGRELARHGAVLICGGLGGIMEAACRGASEAGGLTIGILPGEDRRPANPYVQLAIASGVGRARNLAVVKSARAVIAISGRYGTLSEISFALQSGIPVIGLNTWSLIKNGQPDTAIIPAQDAVQAVTLAMELAI
jgi:uncharacterized protein (TIGR00725 family)